VDYVEGKSCAQRDSSSDVSVIQPVTGRYTDCAVPAPCNIPLFPGGAEKSHENRIRIERDRCASPLGLS
jgi:hypothetical protein